MPDQRPPLRIAVIGEDPLARAGLAALVGSSPELSLVAELAPSELEAAMPLDADAVVWDFGAADEAQPGAANSVLAVPVVALVTNDAAFALGKGWRAVLSRDVDAERLQAAVRAVSSGLVVLDEAFADALGKPRRVAATEPADMLTPREVEVLGLLAEGLSNKLVAARLGISEHTVKFHVNAILDKLEVDTRTEAVVRAARLGLLLL